ncbi:MAG: C25 family cysteine peptidase [Kiritimatiellae bacterium]|nr:C25 family cysteine peptidase [Kiritimatiellia bacterium]
MSVKSNIRASSAMLLGAALSCLAASPADGLHKTLKFTAPSCSVNAAGNVVVTLPGCEPDVVSALPVLPVAGVSFDVEDGWEVEDVRLAYAGVTEIPLTAPVQWGMPPYLYGEAPGRAQPDPAVYLSEVPYPDISAPVWRTDRSGKKTLLSVKVFPVRFVPARNRLLAASEVTVSVTLRAAAPLSSPLKRTVATPAIFSMPQPLDPAASYSYIVISTTSLIHNTPAPWNLQALCEHRSRSGLVPLIVPVEDIYACYAGNNNPEKIRAFLQEAYALWETRFLLIAGTFELIPVQKLYLSFVDFFMTRTAEIPADAIYYGCMEGSYDNNGNGRYGEITDGINGGDVDLTAEIMVGRFPVADPRELAHMVRKTIRYETASEQDVEPNVFMAEKMDMGAVVYADGYMEELRLGSTAYALESTGFESSAYTEIFDTDSRLYDSDAGLWSAADSLAFLNRNLHTVNHIGHGAIKICAKISLANSANQTALRSFTNEMPYFMYSQACDTGAFDTPDCFAEQLVTVSNAAFAAVMNARSGWLYNDVIGGHSHRFHRAFWDSALRGNATAFGEVNELSRRMNLHMLTSYAANHWRWVYYELNLFGDPATPFAPSVNIVPPSIGHEPLINTYDTQTAYRVACRLEPVGIYNPDEVYLVWQLENTPSVTHTQNMLQVEGNLFAAFIPPQTNGTSVAYRITAANHAGVLSSNPVVGNHAFHVTDRLELTVSGSYNNYGMPDPDYGVHYYASGLVANASAPTVVDLTDDTRATLAGYFGTGSAPQHGIASEVSFQMHRSSMLFWLWQNENRLLVKDGTGTYPDQISWGAQDAPIAVPPALPMLSLPDNSDVYFAGWLLDGCRFPAAPGHSAPDPGPVAMDAPHVMQTCYLPAGLDADNNNIPDWWEHRYYGQNGQDPDSDDDYDGHTLAEEYADRSDPLLYASVPAAPVITHQPLDEIQRRPGPFTVGAAILDTHIVASARVRWRQGAGDWRETAMSAGSNDWFTADIAAGSQAGDDFEYMIVASDPSGRVSQTAPHYLFLVFPVADTSRFHDLHLTALPTQIVVGVDMNLHNTGNSDLLWFTRLARVERIDDPSLDGWSRASLEQEWNASTNRFASPPYSLHARPVSGGLATSAAVRATITLPPLLLGPNAKLSFKHWIHSEVYQNTARAFDGGIIEFSADNGETFQQLKGPYTHTIYGWAYSPWPEGTPCLAGKGTDDWTEVVFDLAQEYPERNGFHGQEIVFRFHYGGDNNTDNEGWYVDDVTVSPLLWRQGFYNDIELGYNNTVTPGQNKRIFWYNQPVGMDLRDDNLTVFIESNDPVNPLFSFFWQLKIRDYPSVSNLFARQSANGDGIVSLAGDFADVDGDPLRLAFEWSGDNGKSWLTAALTNVTDASGEIASYAGDGTLEHVLTVTNNLPFMNTVASTWNSSLTELAHAVNTQMLFRVTVSNSCFGSSYVTPEFTVDNVPPVFLPGTLTCDPFDAFWNYAVTTNQLTLNWPHASDAPLTNFHYRLAGVGDTNVTAHNSITLSLSNILDAAHTFSVAARDAAGNVSAPLEAVFLVLDADGDYDGDGMSTSDEQNAGTSAADASSRFVVALAPLAGNGSTIRLSWQSYAGRLYTVEFSDSLQPPAWQPLAGFTDIPGTGEPITTELPRDRLSRFFRISVRLP